MSGIVPVARNAFRTSAVRAAPAAVVMPRFYSSTMHDNDPELLEQEKRRNLSKEQHKTSTPMPHAPGWNEHLASASEAAVKADYHTISPQEMQDHTIKYLKGRHHSGEAAPTEPGVTTQKMSHNGTGEVASYVKEVIDGPLKSAHGKVVEKVEQTEEVIKRKVA